MSDIKNFYYPIWKITIKRLSENKEVSDMTQRIGQINRELSYYKDEFFNDAADLDLQTEAAKKVIENLQNYSGVYSIFDLVLNPHLIIPPRLGGKEKLEISSIQELILTQLKILQNMIFEAELLQKKMNDHVRKEEIRDLPESIEISRTDHILSQAVINFWDPKSEIYSSFLEADEIDLEVGWSGESESRYKLQKVFSGIVTNKSSTLGQSAGRTTITCHDERAVLADRIINDVKGDNGINWKDCVADLWTENKISVALDPKALKGVSSQMILKDTTALEMINRSIEAEELNMYQEFDGDGNKKFVINKESERRNVFEFVWQDGNMPQNIISLTSNVFWEPAQRKPRETSPDTVIGEYKLDKYKTRPEDNPKERSRDDYNGDRISSNIQSVVDDATMLGNDPKDERLISPQIANRNEAKQERLMNFNYCATLTVRGEPQISTRDKVELSGINPSCDGEYYVKSVTHNLGKSNFTTTLDLEYKSKPTKQDLGAKINEHHDTGKYWGPNASPHFTEQNGFTRHVPKAIRDYRNE